MKILSVDDNTENLYLIETIVRSHGHEIVSAHNGEEALQQLSIQTFDLIVSDILMPVMDGFQLCRTVKSDQRLKNIPFVFYTATYTAKQDEELALALGASRYIRKPLEPDQFMEAIDEVVRDRETGSIPVPVPDLGDDQKTLSLYNTRLVRKLERKVLQLENARTVLTRAIEDRNREIGQRRLAEEALALSEEQLRLMWDAAMDGLLLTDREGTILRANPTLARMFGRPLNALPGQLLTSLYGEDSESALARYRERVESRSVEANFEIKQRRPDGEQIWLEGASTIVELPSGPVVLSVFRDVTQRKRSEQERVILEEQLRQSQKLESIGRLAGGIAHDFNNLLTVINGYSELLLGKMKMDEPQRECVAEIRRAGDRASVLTQGLLAFSRKQARQPRVLDMNRVVEETRPMLARLVGEDVELLVQLHPKTVVVYADPNQLEQVLMNLTVNSRDAMPRGGKLWIETDIVNWGQDEIKVHPGARTGRYVVLAVGDDGEGMTEETRQHLFEPFFTTKEIGRGTGLGLSVVQGIVVQGEGFIEIHSELGHGTVFKIFWPAAEGVPSDSETPIFPAEPRGKETVLVVEDQPEVRKYVAAALQNYGYRVFEAVGIEDALLLCERERGDVDLLVTDVVMPKGSGADLADRIGGRWSGIKVLFMSGYATRGAAPYGLPVHGKFIQKPFSPEQLAIKVREVLTERDGPAHEAS